MAGINDSEEERERERGIKRVNEEGKERRCQVGRRDGCRDVEMERWEDGVREREREECFKDEKMKKQKSRRRMGNKVVVGEKKRKP